MNRRRPKLVLRRGGRRATWRPRTQPRPGHRTLRGALRFRRDLAALVVTLAAIAVIALARDRWQGGWDLNLSYLLSADPFPGAVAACGRGALTGEVTRVRDGDTIEVRGVPIRLSGLAAPERGDRGGAEAAAAMRALFAGRSLHCRLDGSRTHDRCAGVCYLDGADIAAELVRRGLARDCPRYSGGRYAAAERAAARAGATIGAAYRLPGYCRPR